MPRISSGVCGCSSWSEGGVGDGGFFVESGVAVTSRWALSVGTGSGRVVFRCGRLVSGLVSTGADPSCRASMVVVVVAGSTSCSSIVGALLAMVARRFSS